MGSLIRYLAIATSSVVLLGFVLFAVDETARGSEAQQEKLALELDGGGGAAAAQIAPGAREERAREASHGQVREAVSDVNDVLLAPFGGLVESGNAWVRNGVPTLLGLLVYGLLLALLANAFPKSQTPGRDWRTA